MQSGKIVKYGYVRFGSEFCHHDKNILFSILDSLPFSKIENLTTAELRIQQDQGVYKKDPKNLTSTKVAL